MTATAYIGLGSNLGDRLASMRRAVGLLGQIPGLTIDHGGIASLYETQPVELEQMPHFLNSALRVRITEPPVIVLEAMLEIERLMGRKRQIRWESRVIDLDLLLVDQVVIDVPSLTLPHPRLHERRFVLEPLAEIAGRHLHPLLGCTIQALRQSMKDAEEQQVCVIEGPHWADLHRC